MSLKNFFFVFQTSSEKSSDNGQSFWLRSLNGILAVQRNIFRNFLLKFEDSFCHFQTFWKKSGRLSKLHSIIPEVRLVKSLFQLKSLFFHFLRTWSSNFWTVGVIFLACLPISHSRNTKMIFRGKQSFKERIFLSFSDFDRKTFGLWQIFFDCVL